MVVLFIIACVSTSFAQIRPGAFSVSPFVGGYTFEGSQDLKTRPVYGLRAGYDFTNHLGAELLFDYVFTKHTPAGSEVDTDVYNYRVEGLYHFMPEKRLVPFVAIGAGGQTIKQEDNKTRFVADYGAGLKYFLTDYLALRADVRHVLAFGSTYNNLEYAVGLTFYFGGTKAASSPLPARAQEAEPMAPPPKEPEPAPEASPPPPVEEMQKAPEAASEVEQKMMEKGRAKLNVEFCTGKASVKPKYYEEIQNVAEVMNKYPDLKIVIEGHTDNVGGKQYNLKLSQRRAEAIKKIMVTKFKIDPARITAKGFGYSKPVASNSTDEGRQRNRRVEAAVEYDINK